jgi:hypothetical protein
LNEYDKRNLHFLLGLKTKKAWKEWSKTISMDDIDYAYELFSQHSKELEMAALDREVEFMLESLNGNYAAAKQVINKILRK